MSFGIGVSGVNAGPRGALEGFGEGTESGRAFDRRIIFRLLGYLAPYKGRMVGAFVLMAISSLLTLVAPYLIKVAFDQALVNRDTAQLSQLALGVAAAFVGMALASGGQQYLLSWVGQRVLMNLRSQLFTHLQELSMEYHDRHIVGVTISRVVSDVSVINEMLSDGLITLASDLLVLAGIVVVMVSMSPKLALLTFCVLPLMVALTVWFARRAQTAFRQTRSRIAAVVGDLAENISGMRVIQAFAQEMTSHERFERINRENRDAYVAAMSLSFIFLPAVEFLSMLATGIVLWFGGRAVAGGELTLGLVVAFLSYVSRFFQPIQELSQLYTTMQAAMAGGERVLELLDTAPAVADAPDAVDLAEIEGRITLRDLSFAYQAGNPVLRHVDLEIAPGEMVALVGPTGAGKTSIASLVARFYDATEGAVLIDGVDVRKVRQRSLRRQMGLAPQDPFLFHGTIADNIRFGRPDATLEQVEAAARLANAHEFIAVLPEGYEMEIVEGGINLSLGQRQLIGIARAMLADPRILILDEATACVDTMTEGLIQEALQRLLKGRTALVIAHRLSTIREADRICVVQDGRLVEQGTHAELLAREGVYAALHQRQFGEVESRK